LLHVRQEGRARAGRGQNSFARSGDAICARRVRRRAAKKRETRGKRSCCRSARKRRRAVLRVLGSVGRRVSVGARGKWRSGG
jgi:hypothetical protein